MPSKIKKVFSEPENEIFKKKQEKISNYLALRKSPREDLVDKLLFSIPCKSKELGSYRKLYDPATGRIFRQLPEGYNLLNYRVTIEEGKTYYSVVNTSSYDNKGIFTYAEYVPDLSDDSLSFLALRTVYMSSKRPDRTKLTDKREFSFFDNYGYLNNIFIFRNDPVPRGEDGKIYRHLDTFQCNYYNKAYLRWVRCDMPHLFRLSTDEINRFFNIPLSEQRRRIWRWDLETYLRKHVNRKRSEKTANIEDFIAANMIPLTDILSIYDIEKEIDNGNNAISHMFKKEYNGETCYILENVQISDWRGPITPRIRSIVFIDKKRDYKAFTYNCGKLAPYTAGLKVLFSDYTMRKAATNFSEFIKEISEFSEDKFEELFKTLDEHSSVYSHSSGYNKMNYLTQALTTPVIYALMKSEAYKIISSAPPSSVATLDYMFGGKCGGGKTKTAETLTGLTHEQLMRIAGEVSKFDFNTSTKHLYGGVVYEGTIGLFARTLLCRYISSCYKQSKKDIDERIRFINYCLKQDPTFVDEILCDEEKFKTFEDILFGYYNNNQLLLNKIIYIFYRMGSYSRKLYFRDVSCLEEEKVNERLTKV